MQQLATRMIEITIKEGRLVMGCMPYEPLPPCPDYKERVKKETERQKRLRRGRERAQREDARWRRRKLLKQKRVKANRIKLLKSITKKYFLWIVMALIFIWLTPDTKQTTYEDTLYDEYMHDTS